MSFYVYRIVAPVKLYRHLKLTRPNCHSIPTDILKTFSYYTIFYLCRNTGIWPMYLNFPVFATGVRIFRASNDVGSWVHMNTRKKHKVRNKMAGYCLISYYCRFPWFLKNKRMECTNLVDPHQLLCPQALVSFKGGGIYFLNETSACGCAPGLLSYSYYFAYIPPTICPQDRLSTKAEVYFGFSRTPTCL